MQYALKKGFNKKTILLHRDFYTTEGALKCEQTMPTSHPRSFLEPDMGTYAHITAEWYMSHLDIR